MVWKSRNYTCLSLASPVKISAKRIYTQSVFLFPLRNRARLDALSSCGESFFPYSKCGTSEFRDVCRRSGVCLIAHQADCQHFVYLSKLRNLKA